MDVRQLFVEMRIGFNWLKIVSNIELLGLLSFWNCCCYGNHWGL